jgi:hypothetical protein
MTERLPRHQALKRRQHDLGSRNRTTAVVIKHLLRLLAPEKRAAVLAKAIAAENERKKLEQWLAGRKEAGRAIDVATCEIMCDWGQIADPYGVGDRSPEADCIGQNIFVRSPDSGGWVSLDDLPEERARALHQRIEKGLPEDDDAWIP